MAILSDPKPVYLDRPSAEGSEFHHPPFRKSNSTASFDRSRVCSPDPDYDQDYQSNGHHNPDRETNIDPDFKSTRFNEDEDNFGSLSRNNSWIVNSANGHSGASSSKLTRKDSFVLNQNRRLNRNWEPDPEPERRRRDETAECHFADDESEEDVIDDDQASVFSQLHQEPFKITRPQLGHNNNTFEQHQGRARSSTLGRTSSVGKLVSGFETMGAVTSKFLSARFEH